MNQPVQPYGYPYCEECSENGSGEDEAEEDGESAHSSDHSCEQYHVDPSKEFYPKPGQYHGAPPYYYHMGHPGMHKSAPPPGYYEHYHKESAKRPSQHKAKKHASKKASRHAQRNPGPQGFVTPGGSAGNQRYPRQQLASKRHREERQPPVRTRPTDMRDGSLTPSDRPSLMSGNSLMTSTN